MTHRSTLVIAEAGVNHNGDMNLAKKLIDVAVEAGADIVKFQSFKLSKLVESFGLFSVDVSLTIITENSPSNVEISKLIFSRSLKTDCQSL